MKAMDSWLLFKTRRLCFEVSSSSWEESIDLLTGSEFCAQRWNEVVMNRFKTDPDYRLDTMTHQFLPCLMQLKLGSDEDLAYISEIQRAWCLLLDKLEREYSIIRSTGWTLSLFCSVLLATERSISLEEFLQRLLEYPLGQHYHSVSINKHQLISRYEEAVRELVHRFGPTPSLAHEPQASSVRTTRATSLNTPVSIPVVIHHSQQQHRAAGIAAGHSRGAVPMQQGGDEQPCPPPRPPPPTTPPSTSLPPSSS